MTTRSISPRSVLVTGAGGNLGAKSVQLLARQSWCTKVIALHSPRRTAPVASGKVLAFNADLTDPSGEWIRHLEGVDCVLHFAAANPVPESTWLDAMASSDMNFNLGIAASKAGISRLVNCSSNHAIGGYKDAPLASTVAGGAMTEDMPPAPGTRWNNGQSDLDSTPYGSSKAVAERFFSMLAAQSGGSMSTISLRIGWALPGNNEPREISVSGSPTGHGETVAHSAEEAISLRWFRNMWISNSDFDRLIVASLTADATVWPSPGLIINGVSNNSGTDWSLAAGRKYLGYEPQDDLYAFLNPSTEKRS